jgi:hypothetical protein
MRIFAPCRFALINLDCQSDARIPKSIPDAPESIKPAAMRQIHAPREQLISIGTPVSSTIMDADAVLSLYTGTLSYGVRPNTANGQRMINDANVLTDYNKGVLRAGCGG